MNEIEAFLLKELENARNEPGARLADDMVRAVDSGEVVTSPQGQVDMFKAIRASATPQVMLEISKAIFAAPVTRVVLTTPTSAGGNAAVLAALKAPVTARDDRLTAVKADFKELPAFGPPGPITSTRDRTSGVWGRRVAVQE